MGNAEYMGTQTMFNLKLLVSLILVHNVSISNSYLDASGRRLAISVGTKPCVIYVCLSSDDMDLDKVTTPKVTTPRPIQSTNPPYPGRQSGETSEKGMRSAESSVGKVSCPIFICLKSKRSH